MSIKKAQSITNAVYDRAGISLTSFQTNEIEWLKDQLETFLELEVDTEELSDPADLDFEGSDEDACLDYADEADED